VFCEPLFPNRISSSRCVAFEPWAELYPRSLSMRQDLSHISMKRARRTMICEWSRSVSTPQSVNEAGRPAGVWFADKGRTKSHNLRARRAALTPRAHIRNHRPLGTPLLPPGPQLLSISRRSQSPKSPPSSHISASDDTLSFFACLFI